MFRGKTNVFLGIVALRRLNTCLLCLAQVPRLKTKPFYMKLVDCFIEVFLRRNTAVQRRNMRLPLRNTAVLRENRRLLRGNLKHPPDCTPYKFLMLLVSGEEEIRLEYHKLLLLSNPAMKNGMHLFYHIKDSVVKDNLMKFGIISSHIFQTAALRSSHESPRIVRNSFARSGGIMT